MWGDKMNLPTYLDFDESKLDSFMDGVKDWTKILAIVGIVLAVAVIIIPAIWRVIG
jgi:hypothetical protein